VRSVVRAPRSTALFKIPTQVNDSARKIRVMPTAAKRENFSAPMVWTDECVLPLAASGVYPKTRVWGSREKMLHCFSATAPLSGNARRGWENSSGKTAAGSALDYNGNTQSKTDSTGTTNYTWDFENRLTSVTLPGSGGTVTFKYDPFGRRIQKSFTQNGTTTTTNFLYDASNLIEEVDASGNALARYMQTRNIDEPLAMLRGGTTSYYHADALGSVTSLSNPSGSLANTYTYDSFGKLTASTGSLVNPFRFTARDFDTETNLQFSRARYYDPGSGRFLSEDRMRFRAGVDFYSYVWNNSVNRVDPFGLLPSASCACKIAAGALSGGIAGGRIGGKVGGFFGGVGGGIAGLLGGAAGGELAEPVGGGIPGGAAGAIGGAAAGAAAGSRIGAGVGAAVGALIGALLADRTCDDTKQDRCKQVKADCIDSCSDSSLPSGDNGFRFWNCVNRCLEAAGCR
jgi:RHS repeat-associated protein